MNFNITSILVGVLYGTCSVMVGHPLDTIKTKMQAQRGFESTSMVRTMVKTVKSQGVIGLYRLLTCDISTHCRVQLSYYSGM